MSARLNKILTSLVVVSLAGVGLAVAGSAQAATTPPFEPDPSSVGSLSFYDAAGNVITGGSTNSAPFAAYVVGSKAVRAGDTKSLLYFANPVPNTTPDNFYVEQDGRSTTYPTTTAPAAINTLSNTRPVNVGRVGDQTLEGFEADSSVSTVDGYKNVVQVRMRTANADSQITQTYDSADVMIDPTTHTWTQIYPAPATVAAPGAPTNVSAVAGDAQATVTWTAPTDNGGSAITGYTLQYSANGGAFVNVPHTGTTTSQVVTGLTNGTSYVFRIAAVNGIGTGAFSADSAAVTPAAGRNAGSYSAIAPTRVLDTRSGVGASGPVKSAGTVSVSVSAGGLVPAGVSAVVLNVTALAATGHGFATVWADGQTRPGASNLNFVQGQTVPNLVVAPVGADGKVDIYNGSGGTVQFLADVSGYFVGGAATTPGSYSAIAPTRVLDTRSGVGASGPVQSAGTVSVSVSAGGLVPAGVSAVVLNVTALAATGHGFATVWADGKTRPGASNLNFVQGQTVPNLVVAPVGADGKVDIYNGSGGTVQFLADVSGYFVGGAATTPGSYSAIAPTRVLDTRSGVGASGPVQSAGTVSVSVSAGGLVPAGVSAVVLNVTALAATGHGFATVWADGKTRPGASNLNFVQGQTVPNLVVAPVGADGKVDIYNGSGGTVQFLADVAGYVTGTG